jgi:UDP-2,3-diacylglucosamine pyrophosphatase LpxH
MKKVNDCWDFTYLKKCTFRFLSDLHLDSPYTDLKKVKKLFDEAKEKDYKIVIIGDLLDVMGGKFDRRTIKGDLRPEHNVDNYINKVCEDAADFLLPYIDNIALITAGNHEKEIDKRMECYLLEFIDLYIHKKSGKSLNWTQEYAGYIRLHAKRKNSQHSECTKIFFCHGKDGNATMSFGVLNVKRNASVIDADIMISGHVHKNYSVPLNRLFLNTKGVVRVKEQLHLQLGTSKESKGVDYFSARKGFDPASTSFYDVDFELKHSVQDGNSGYYVEFIERRVKLS